ncbi:MAG: hypothetical protein DGJ47_000270 [Rickettsiaceae bacterium]
MTEDNIIDGKKISKLMLQDLKSKNDAYLAAGNKAACLAIIMVGNNPASEVYIKNKRKAAAVVGIESRLIHLSEKISEEELLEQIQLLNNDAEVSGIIVQLPIPDHIDKNKVINTINPNKDVDGFHPLNVGKLYSPENNNFVPCTALGCLRLIKSCVNNLSGKQVVMIGRSSIVGRPLAALLLKEDCTITICHSKTKNLQSLTKQADIVISAIGRPQYLTKDYFSKHAIVIDVGISKIKFGDKHKLVGDVDFENVRSNVAHITPVPGGVGPMTVAYLLINTFNAKLNQ